MKHFLQEAIEIVTIYKTPERILKVIEQEIIIKNSPYGIINL